MAFLKRASAVVVHPRISGKGWGGVRKTASSASGNLTDQARKILGGSLDPNEYLFTHCTIVASVDTDKVPGVKLGKVKLGSQTVDRRFEDYYIKPNCSQFVNNNGDSWSRDVLKMAFPTFIGAHNFQEHVQIEEQSKGRIIDAVARDIGDSLYVDILVATNRKHASLVQDIESGKMATLSMGCTTDFTICSKCGHYAVDETELCEHIRHAKLNTFLDDSGQKRVIAELCGHASYNENPEAPGGVRFIEASWVAVPAFPGAVMRNVMTASETGVSESEIRQLLSVPSYNWSDAARKKAASLAVPNFGSSRTSFDFGGDDSEEKESEAPKPPFRDLENSVYEMVMSKVRQRFESQMSEREKEKALEKPLPQSDAPNDSLIKDASLSKKAARYKTALRTLVVASKSDVALVEGIAQVNRSYGVLVPRSVYRSVLKVGGISNFEHPKSFVEACSKEAGQDFSLAELRVVVRVGTLLSSWESTNNPKRNT